MSTERDLLQNSTNPIDNVEDILLENNWVFERMSNDNLAVSVKGKSCNYHLYFIWQEDMSALQFCCQYDFPIPSGLTFATLKTLTNVNKDLWMGHFDIPETTKIPSFRHTSLLHGSGGNNSTSELIEDMMDIALVQCERFYPVFHLLANDTHTDDAMLSLALMETAGES